MSVIVFLLIMASTIEAPKKNDVPDNTALNPNSVYVAMWLAANTQSTLPDKMVYVAPPNTQEAQGSFDFSGYSEGPALKTNVPLHNHTQQSEEGVVFRGFQPFYRDAIEVKQSVETSSIDRDTIEVKQSVETSTIELIQTHTYLPKVLDFSKHVKVELKGSVKQVCVAGVVINFDTKSQEIVLSNRSNRLAYAHFHSVNSTKGRSFPWNAVTMSKNYKTLPNSYKETEYPEFKKHGVEISVYEKEDCRFVQVSFNQHFTKGRRSVAEKAVFLIEMNEIDPKSLKYKRRPQEILRRREEVEFFDSKGLGNLELDLDL